MVVTVWPDGRSGVVPTGPEDDEADEEGPLPPPRLFRRPINSGSSPFSAMGAGSCPRRMNLSASIVKHLSVGSEMYGCGLCSRRERDWTQSSRAESLGSTRGTRRVTMLMQDWAVSLCRVAEWCIRSAVAAGRPPASYTLSDSLAHASSSTCGGRGRDSEKQGGRERNWESFLEVRGDHSFCL